MKIGVAQIKPAKGDILQNIYRHKKIIAQAITQGTDGIFFPELSLTSYEPELAESLATAKNDMRFMDLQQLSDQHNILIGAGMPLINPEGITISMLIFRPHRQPDVYSKQYLHSDEEPFFISGKNGLNIIETKLRIAPAICYEISILQHASDAASNQAEVYIASVAKSATGVEKAHTRMAEITRQYKIPALMANCVGPCDNFVGAGGSAVWDHKGNLVKQLNAIEEGILLVEIEE